MPGKRSIMTKAAGVCVGASSLQAVLLQQETNGTHSVLYKNRIAHQGNPSQAFLEAYRDLKEIGFDRAVVTGRSFRTHVDWHDISEPEAVEFALQEECRAGSYPDVVISFGSESQLVYEIHPSHGGIISTKTGNKCASGTGEFFVQQLGRMGIDIDELESLSSKEEPYHVAGRCSVFCKSDCTHALNKGIAKERIVNGLCEMMTDKACDLVQDASLLNAVAIGGGTKNNLLMKRVRDRFASLTIPSSSDVFEAFGSALYALDNGDTCVDDNKAPIGEYTRCSSFATLPRIEENSGRVRFAAPIKATAHKNDACVLGVDVGSTTTKAVLMRCDDSAIVASVYLRTNGNPIGAACQCYSSLVEQLCETPVIIRAMGVTGSGRRIVALHAFSKNVINEIVAHAVAASHFDPEVDTVFEIGGQDAKYTFLVNAVASDYAMNEACSAGTGSFLEEAAGETLGIEMGKIADYAMRAQNPLDFSDQCSAFIASDIKRAISDHIEKDDIVAGLVYSICQNYINRVKGSRATGKTVFMQGGVCYNKAIPIAMANITGTRIVVPPHPGLMGAFGVALEVRRRINGGEIQPQAIDLGELKNRRAQQEGSFTCNGGVDKCDRKCEIARIRIGSQRFFFGGACNKYYSAERRDTSASDIELDYVQWREEKLRVTSNVVPHTSYPLCSVHKKSVGINRSFLSYSLLPLFSRFFHCCGFSVIYTDDSGYSSASHLDASFCYPAQRTHANFEALLAQKPDYVFLPQIMQIPVENVPTYSRLCNFVQGEPYYIKTAFREEIEISATIMLSPVLRMDRSYEQAEETMVDIAVRMGIDTRHAHEAFSRACRRQRRFEGMLRAKGQRFLEFIRSHPDTTGVVLFGRPYNAFTSDMNMAIPRKLVSHAIPVCPCDMLPADEYPVHEKMFWAMGQRIMKTARLVARTDNLYGLYISNFSCGPDSFLISFFRDIMDKKPSLTLELDQHTADAGVNTRVEAFLDIIHGYRLCGADANYKTMTASSNNAVVEMRENGLCVRSIEGQLFPLTHSGVEVVIPPMHMYGAPALAAVLRSMGIQARVLPRIDEQDLRIGRRNTSNKECLPYIVCTGSFVNYLENTRKSDVITLLFMTTGGGPCRLGQYQRGLEQVIRQRNYHDVAVLTMSDENGYAGMGARTLLRAWQAVVVGDIFHDIRSMLSVCAREPDNAVKKLDKMWRECELYFEGGLSCRLSTLISSIVQRLDIIPLAKDPEDVPVISLVGEIFVRNEPFSRKNIVRYLEQKGFMVKVAPVGEYMCYSNYVVNKGLGERQFTFAQYAKMLLTEQTQLWWERRIKGLFAKSSLYSFEMIDVADTIESVTHLLDKNFRGECILTVGLALREILRESCGVISIGPFGCMPSRIAEAILNKEMNAEGKKRIPGWGQRAEHFRDLQKLPFLAIETDGGEFSQITSANLESFVLQARRTFARMKELETTKKHVLKF